MLRGIEIRNIDVDEAYCGILKRGNRGSGEIAVAGANANNQVRFASELVRC